MTINKTAHPKYNVTIPVNNIVRVAEDLYIGDGCLKLTEGSYLTVGNEFYVDNGGTISTEYTIFELLESQGITINQGGLVDLLHSFNHCAFRESPLGGELLNINNDQDIIIDGARFQTNSWSGNYNAVKVLNQGHVTFLNVTGSFAGEIYEKDPVMI